MLKLRIAFLLVVLLCLVDKNYSLEPYDLPVVPDSIKQKLAAAKATNSPSDKHIPRKAWIAVRNVSDTKPNHMLGPNGFIQRNSNWDINFCDNEMKDSFMEQQYAGSSILWAYNILNPAIGTSKVEIWRLAVLYLYGGMYMDDDANIDTKLDDVVLPTDKFLVGKEPYDFDDRCYTPDFVLSNHSTMLRFFNQNNAYSAAHSSVGADNKGGASASTAHPADINTAAYQQVPVLFENKFFFNWALFSSTGNPLLLRIMEHIVVLLKHEYLSDSKIKLSPVDHRGKLLMCATTFPITHAAREMVFENKETEQMGLRVGGVYFKEYGAQMKAWNNDWRPDRWVKQIHKHRMPYLRAYAPPRAASYEGKVIQAKGQREIYLVKDGTRRAFPDFGTFVAMKFSLEDVHLVSTEVFEVIKLGLPMPYKNA